MLFASPQTQTPETLGKNSQATKNAVLASKEQYYKDLHKNKGKKGSGRHQASSTVLDKAVRAAHAQQQQQQAKARMEDGDKKSITRQTNFCLPSQARPQSGGCRKKKPSKRDRSFNSDLRVQESYAPIAKVIHPGPHQMGQAGLYKAPPGLYPPSGRSQGVCFAPGAMSDDPFGLLSFGSASMGGHSGTSNQPHAMAQMDDLTQAKFLSRHPQGLDEYCQEAGTILPGMVRPPANMDVPITAFRAAQAAGNPEGDPSQAQDDFQAMQLEQLLQQMSNPGSGGGRDPYFIFPPSDADADAIRMGSVEGKRGPHRSEEDHQDSLFSAMTTQSLTSQVNSAAAAAGLDLHHQSRSCNPSGAPLSIPESDFMAQAGVKSEFDIYFEKLLDYHQGETQVKGEGEGEGYGMVPGEGAALRGKVAAVGSHGHSASLDHSGQGAQNQGSKHEIEENLSAFLNNISLTDIPEIAEIAGLCDMVPTDKAFKTTGSDMSLLNNFEL